MERGGGKKKEWVVVWDCTQSETICIWHQKTLFVCIYKPNISFLTKVFLGLASKGDYSLHASPNQGQNRTLRVVETTNLPSNTPWNLRTETGLREHLVQLPHSTQSSLKHLTPFTNHFLGTSYVQVTMQQRIQKEERTSLPSRRLPSGRKDKAVT